LKLVNPFYAAGASGVKLLKEKAIEWYKTYQELEKIPDSELSESLYLEKQSLLKRGKNIVYKIRSMGLGADVLQEGLGALPIIAVGVIVTAASLMLYWTYDFIKFKNKLAEYRSVIASGGSVNDATHLIRALEPDGFLAGTGKVMKYGLILGGLFVGYKIAQSQKWIS